eukprot:m.29436 g.29436  ORF g.29436 m.29436 type:complete len:220 (+) comp9576_c0_seq1:96-755(+)
MTTVPSFLWYQDHADRDQKVKEEIQAVTQELSVAVRSVEQQLQKAHHMSVKKTQELVAEVKDGFSALKELFAKLSEKVPAGEFFKYNGNWRWATQQAVFLVCLAEYYETSQLMSLENVRSVLGVETDSLSEFHIDVEDYLMGVCNLPAELSRLAVNSVSMGDFVRPVAIARFVADLYSGFKLLNLKNDSLRRKFDSLKYDLKNIEQVVYDLRIRGLVKD